MCVCAGSQLEPDNFAAGTVAFEEILPCWVVLRTSKFQKVFRSMCTPQRTDLSILTGGCLTSSCLANSTDGAVGGKKLKTKHKKNPSSSRRVTSRRVTVLPAAIQLQAPLAQRLTRWEEQGWHRWSRNKRRCTSSPSSSPTSLQEKMFVGTWHPSVTGKAARGEQKALMVIRK